MRTKVTASIVVIAVVSCLILLTRRVSKGEDISERSVASAESATNEGPGDTKRQNKGDRNLSRARRALQSIVASKDLESGLNDAENVTTLSKTELAKTLIMVDAVKDNFFNDAPAAFDELLSEEKIDPQWTYNRKGAMEKLLNDGKNPVLEGVALNDVRCFETMCKIEVTSRGVDSLVELRVGMENDDTLFGPAHHFSMNKGGDLFETAIYVGRPEGGDEMDNKVVSRLYQNLTGHSPEEIEPTQEALDEVTSMINQS